MANNQISQFLEFANVQMGAEAFLLRDTDGGIIPSANVIRDRLEDGNSHASKFMPVQAQEFTNETTGYQVLAQFRNDSLLTGNTGFSGTLFRNRSTNKLTLAFRSTASRPRIGLSAPFMLVPLCATLTM